MSGKADKASKKAKPTEADRRAAARIKTAWESRLKGSMTQEELGQRFKDVGDSQEGISQSAISQYLNGAVPINTFAVLFFAHALKMHPTEIRDDLPPFVLELLREPPSASGRIQVRTGPMSDFPFPFSRERWDAVPDAVKNIIIATMKNAVEMPPEPVSGGRRSTPSKS